MKVNSLPTLTWNFLKLNYAHIETASDIGGSFEVDIKNNPDALEVTEDTGLHSDIKGGMGAEADSFFNAVGCKCLYIKAKKGMQANEPLRIDLEAEDQKGAAANVIIEAQENSGVDIILNLIGSDDAPGLAAINIKANIGDGARLRLVNTNLLGRKQVYFENIGAAVGERACFSLIQMELGAFQTYMGVNVDLNGYKSEFEGNSGYLVRGEELLDMNYMINHIAKKSVSSLMVKGALKDKAVKNFRGTIDLRRGAKGAVGDEQEETLLLSEGVKNKTLPIILCDEEDVEGTHGASIGRLSEDVLFYMTSRGLSEAEVEVLMTRAKLDSIRRLIDDEESQGRIQHYLESNLGK